MFVRTAMLVVFLQFLLTTKVLSTDACPKVEKIGCFIDTLNPRPLPELLVNDRDPSHPAWSGQPIDWYNFDHYLQGFVCRCAEKTKAHGYGYFGLQFYGECWSGPGAESRFAMHGPSEQCIMGLAIPPMYCNRTSARPCVGVPHTNYIYKVINKDIKLPQDGSWSPWGPWTPCSKTCSPGVRSRERTCTNPPPENGGKNCAGNVTQQEVCSVGKCPTPCRRDLDLSIVLDSSSSIGQTRYKTAKDFLGDLVSYTQGSIKGTRIGIIVYNQLPYVQATFNQTGPIAEVIEFIHDLPYLHGGTRTDKALAKAASDLYSLQGGDREDVPNVLLVVTDGRTNHHSEPYSDALRPLKAHGVSVIAVGVGTGVNQSELLEIAMGHPEHVFTVTDYKDLYSKLNEIVDNVCKA